MSSGGNRIIPSPPFPELLADPLTLREYRLRLVVLTHFVFYFLMPELPPGWWFALRPLLPSLPALLTPLVSSARLLPHPHPPAQDT